MDRSERAAAGLQWGLGLHAPRAAVVDAEAYFAYLGRWSALFVPAALAAANVRAGARVLDVATGPGEAARQASSVVGSRGRVIGTDISVAMLAAGRAGLPAGSCHLVASDAQALPFLTRSFDAVICQLGLMFLPDPGAALAEFHRVLKSGARAAACVLSTAARAPMWGALAEALSAVLPSEADTLRVSFALAEPTRVASLFGSAGFGNVRVRRERRIAALASFAQYWALVEAGVGQLPHAYTTLPESTREEIRAQVRRRLMAYQSLGRLELPIEMIIGTGQKEVDAADPC